MSACSECGSPQRTITRYEGSIPYRVEVCEADGCPINMSQRRRYERGQMLAAVMALGFLVVLAVGVWALLDYERSECVGAGGRWLRVYGRGGYVCVPREDRP